METVAEQFTVLVGSYIPHLAGALGILVVGWLVALVVSRGVRGALKRTTLDNRLAGWLFQKESGQEMEAEKWFGAVVFWVIMVFVFVGFFQALQLTVLTEPLNRLLGGLFEYAPRLLGAGILLAIAWVLATVSRAIVSRVLRALRVDERLAEQAGMKEAGLPLSQTLGEAVYWLVFLLFLPALLGALALEGIVAPVQGMIDILLGFLPNLLGAGLILVVGWFVARIVQRVVANLLIAIGTDQFSERVGLARALGTQRLSGLVSLVVYTLILIPVVVGALNALALEAITQPASNMLNAILGALPVIFAAALVVAIAYIVGRVVADLVRNVLAGIGFDSIPVRLGLAKDDAREQRSLSEIAGALVLVAFVFFAAMEASRLLGFIALAGLMADFLVFAGQVLLGLAIFAVGLYLANLAADAVSASRVGQAGLLALVTRVAIVSLATAMALRQMGLANEIINLAFGLVLGALALAVGLAFGLGAREIAARELDGWLAGLRSGASAERSDAVRTQSHEGAGESSDELIGGLATEDAK